MFGSQWLANAGSTYEIDQSIRFNAADSPYLTKTFGADGGDTWTFSLWIKRSEITSGGNWYFFSEAGGSGIGFVDSTDKLRFYNASAVVDSTQVFRDVGGWYHFVFSNNAGTVTITVNNTAVEIGSTTATLFNRNNAWHIGSYYDGGNNFEGYMAEMNWVDGQALSPTSFGETNDDGVWVPKKYTGSYGTNGFFIDGRDSSDLGADYSGNGNDFTSSGLAAADQVTDTPTNNFATFSPINRDGVTTSDGNLFCASAGYYSGAAATMSLPTTGKWYIETLVGNRYGSYMAQGFVPNNGAKITDAAQAIYYGASDYTGSSTNYGLGMNRGDKFGFAAASGTTNADVTEPDASTLYSTNEIYICHAIDLDNERYFVGTAFTDDTSVTWFGPAGSGADPETSSEGLDISAYLAIYGSYGLTFFHAPNATSGNPYATVDFGQSGFTFTPPTGFVALSTANLPTPTITDGSQYFHTQTYTGTGSSGLAITNDANFGDFQPDMLLLAPRSNGDNKVLLDVARGVTSRMKTNDSAAQDTDGTALITFESDGFDLDTTDVNYNGSSRTYVAWQWKTQGGAGSSNTAGSINTTTTSVNTTAGISISTFEGNGTAGQTIGHGLGVKPSWIVIKNRDNTEQWIVYHSALGATKYLLLNSTGAVGDSDGAWNDTEPTSTLITLGGGGFGTNVSGDSMVCYAFAEIEGFSRFGTYEGNGNADGPFIHLGFKPAWIMCKSVDSTSDWFIFDSKRLGYNVDNNSLFINDQGSELTADNIDILSNGFKMRVATDPNVAETYIYMAFAEHAFGGDGVAPATAR
jgi:hypothetical protein